MPVCPRNTLKLVNQQPRERMVQNLTQGMCFVLNICILQYIKHLFSLFRRYKTQLKDFLSSCRTKKAKTHDIYGDTSSFPGYPNPAAAAYMSSGALTGYPGAPDTTTLYMQQTANIAASPAAYPTLYPSVDNR